MYWFYNVIYLFFYVCLLVIVKKGLFKHLQMVFGKKFESIWYLERGFLYKTSIQLNQLCFIVIF